MTRLPEILAAVSFATSILVAGDALAAAAAAADSSRLAAQHASWTGGRANAEAIVKGLATGAPVTLVTVGPGNTKSLAGFTAQTVMGLAEIESALAGARQTLARLNIRQPSADQIQAALIGGEITPPGRKAQLVQGTVALRAEPVPVGAVAAR